MVDCVQESFHPDLLFISRRSNAGLPLPKLTEENLQKESDLPTVRSNLVDQGEIMTIVVLFVIISKILINCDTNYNLADKQASTDTITKRTISTHPINYCQHSVLSLLTY